MTREELESAVFQAIGYASVCWSEPPRGIFEDGLARVAAENLLRDIDTYIKTNCPAQ